MPERPDKVFATIRPQRPPPFFETNAFQGWIALATSAVLTVIGMYSRTVLAHWLLAIAGVSGTVSAWKASAAISANGRKARIVATVVGFVGIALVLVFVDANVVHAPQRPDLAQTILDAINKLRQNQSVSNPAPIITEAKQPKVYTSPYAYIEVDLVNHHPFSSFPLALINPGGLSLSGGSVIIQQGSTGGLWQRALAAPKKGSGFSYSKVDLSTPIPLTDIAKQSPDPRYSLDFGNYKLELRIGQETITEHLDLSFRNGEWVRSIEVNAKGKVVFSTPALPDQPDISLRFVNTGNIGLVIDNTSRAVLKDPYYRVVLWPLSKVDVLHPFEWIRYISGFSIARRGSLDIFDLATSSEMAANTTKGDEMYGYATVSCPECIRSKTYTVGFEIGGKGWYSELTPGSSPLGAGQFAQNILKSWGSVNQIPTTFDENRQTIFERPRY